MDSGSDQFYGQETVETELTVGRCSIAAQRHLLADRRPRYTNCLITPEEVCKLRGQAETPRLKWTLMNLGNNPPYRPKSLTDSTKTTTPQIPNLARSIKYRNV
ncbi:hypothetical protein LshimejAT787_0805230 [Lyophyllum shimeji]|uniref:Uncharacterized protein n=1 Tax=Lyophyllum shimeji TaxID=47721 RepID=A0A9P3PSQ1_LYOSH|nr:hypothetical protein LshimejAT787_0805230 [Lyophyllum shimeji]